MPITCGWLSGSVDRFSQRFVTTVARAWKPRGTWVHFWPFHWHVSMVPPVDEVWDASGCTPDLAADLRAEPIVGSSIHVKANEPVVSTTMASRFDVHVSNLPL
jgi:hypothetical protein